ncbi:ATP-binding protein [Streptomyces sp. NRRL S-244]|uniref:ATP-binding protein n=1 Tax=Streptomyces sp. NRRL S-244 TaxID=1463897 RepID=UPI0004BFD2ED|nr:ATP-binding protein [Streptomyces sp. NRRL S-244]
MTVPPQHNPYSVRVPKKRQALRNVESPPRVDYPLVPWSETSHCEQWVDVDHAKAQVDSFRKWLERLPDVVDSGVNYGSLVVVTGPIGMGKTTLIHRCVHEAQKHIERLDPDPPLNQVVAMTAGYDNIGDVISLDDNGRFATIPAINAGIVKQVVGELRTKLAHVDTGISKWPPGEAFEAISELLEQQDALLFVIVPHIAWKDPGVRSEFLLTCLKHARSRIVLFVEISHATDRAKEVVKEVVKHPAVTHLELGRLKGEDRVTFSQAARSGHPDPDAALLTEWEPADVRELRMVYHAAAEHQIRAGEPVRITAHELSHHAERLRREARENLLGALAHDSPPDESPPDDPAPHDPAPDDSPPDSSAPPASP